MFRERVLGLAFATLLVAGGVSLRADVSQFRSFDYPDALATVATGINEPGDIVGFYIDDEGNTHGFLRAHGGAITLLDYPGATATFAMDINDSGQIVGYYFPEEGDERGFLRLSDGTWVAVDYPHQATCQTMAMGVNSRGQVVGFYDRSDDAGGCDGPDIMFIRHANGAYETISNTLTDDSQGGNAINPRGQIVGTVTEYIPDVDAEVGFLREPDGSVVVLQVPFAGAVDTVPFGINPQGVISGFYLYENLDTFGPGHGFLVDRAGNYIEVRYPDAVKTLVGKINAAGWLVGGYYAEDGLMHGFIARFQ